jgi:hypothetical protein
MNNIEIAKKILMTKGQHFVKQSKQKKILIDTKSLEYSPE